MLTRISLTPKRHPCGGAGHPVGLIPLSLIITQIQIRWLELSVGKPRWAQGLLAPAVLCTPWLPGLCTGTQAHTASRTKNALLTADSRAACSPMGCGKGAPPKIARAWSMHNLYMRKRPKLCLPNSDAVKPGSPDISGSLCLSPLALVECKDMVQLCYPTPLETQSWNQSHLLTFKTHFMVKTIYMYIYRHLFIYLFIHFWIFLPRSLGNVAGTQAQVFSCKWSLGHESCAPHSTPWCESLNQSHRKCWIRPGERAISTISCLQEQTPWGGHNDRDRVPHEPEGMPLSLVLILLPWRCPIAFQSAVRVWQPQHRWRWAPCFQATSRSTSFCLSEHTSKWVVWPSWFLYDRDKEHPFLCTCSLMSM